MTTVMKSNGGLWSYTSLVLPLELKEKAKSLGINISKTLREALKARIEEIESEGGRTIE